MRAQNVDARLESEAVTVRSVLASGSEPLLLGTLFDRLIVRDGQIVEYVPRTNRAAEVIALVEQAVGRTGVVTAPQTEYGWRAKGRPQRKTANGGKGGV